MKTATALSAAAALTGLWLWKKRSSRNTGPQVKPPGRPKELDTRLLEAGAALLQGRSPVEAMNMYLDGFHFACDDMGHQMEAHHYCTQINEDFIQCVIYDGNTPDACLMGVEYIICERLFRELPAEEKKLWHSHGYEVESGTLVAPGIPRAVERVLMEKIVGTYGKTWHTWDTQRHALPLGAPMLMMGFTADGQLREQLVHSRDSRFGISSKTRRRDRRDIAVPRVLPGADAWERGEVAHLELEVESLGVP